MKNNMFKRLTSATLSIIMAFSMYTCRAKDSNAEQVAGSSTSHLTVVESKDKDSGKSGISKWVLGTACAIPVIGIAIRYLAYNSQSAPAPKPATAPVATAQPVATPVPKATVRMYQEEAYKILEDHGYSPARHRAKSRVYSHGEGDSNTRPLDGSDRPIILYDDEFSSVVNNVPDQVVYRGVYSAQNPYAMDLGKYRQDLFRDGVLSSQPLGGAAKGIRAEGQGLYFSSEFYGALCYALGASMRTWAVNYQGGFVFQGFLIGEDVEVDTKTCVQSNARLVLRRTPFVLEQDIADLRGTPIMMYIAYVNSKGFRSEDPLKVQTATKYRGQFQRWNIVKNQM